MGNEIKLGSKRIPEVKLQKSFSVHGVSLSPLLMVLQE